MESTAQAQDNENILGDYITACLECQSSTEDDIFNTLDVMFNTEENTDTMQKFSTTPFSDIIYPNTNLGDTEMMLARYHFHNIIYLYGVFENLIAQEIIANNTAKLPIYLYETPKTAYEMSGKHLQNPITLRFAVDITISENSLAYDSLICDMNSIISKTHLKKDDYIKRCLYTREIKTINNSLRVIQYKIQNTQIIKNVQTI